MNLRCVWEHNEDDTILYSVDYIGAYTRGESLETALFKMKREIKSYCNWAGLDIPERIECEVVQEKSSDLQIRDADSDVLFDSEKALLTFAEYTELKHLALKSAADFLKLYDSIPDKHKSANPPRKTFYGEVPRTALEMYEHTKNVNNYYFGEIGVDASNEGSILGCRKEGFNALETQDGFLENRVFSGSYGEDWTLRKLIRRFIWHDRIHAKAMYRMARATFGEGNVPDVFKFDFSF